MYLVFIFILIIHIFVTLNNLIHLFIEIIKHNVGMPLWWSHRVVGILIWSLSDIECATPI